MASISYSLTPVGGDIDKYVVQLYNSAGTVLVTSKTFTPAFPATISDAFTGLVSGTSYKIRTVQYIGSFFKNCPFQDVVVGGGVVLNNVVVQYGYTEADTTGAPLTEGEYVTSVEDAISASNVFSMVIQQGQSIEVTDFGNTSDKVLFVKIPSTESAFATWSEVGNIYQQNIAIDQDFNGSGVWFRSVQGANTYYITRSQTDFAGAVDFMRTSQVV